ncbi:MAG: formylmethanofuran--tetrahydromethanopterin N-formyltransferase [Nitrospinae bacterium]|nr:formylmethanofuran--tetrahydromethanopterin N-formyltransferase [Nitrospinota bacterium]
MEINGVLIEETHAEAFAMPFARLVVTARSGKWALDSTTAAVGCATSIIDCGCEAGFEAHRADFKTPDGRPGHELLFFARTADALKKELIKRVGQTLLPTPTVFVFNGLAQGEPYELGAKIGFFGNGFQKEEKRHGRDCVVVPITSGEFVLEKTVNIGAGVGGANFWIFASSHKTGLKAAEKAVEAIASVPGLIMPFAGGVVAAASRLGSKYDFLAASTQEDYCPGIAENKNPSRKLPKGVEAVFEIVIDAVSREVAEKAMAVGIRAACVGGVVRIGAANFAGKLGDIHLPLREVMEKHPA